MTMFTVYYRGGDEVYEEGSNYKIGDNGVLTTLHTDRRRRVYSPNCWSYIEDQAPPPKEGRAARGVAF